MINLLFTRTPLIFFTQGLWRDEAFSFMMSKLSLIQIAQSTAKDFNPPLYYFFLHFYMLLFGHSEVVLRSMSLIFFAVSIYVAHLFLEEIMHVRNRLWIYTILYAINPFLLYYAFEARMYSLVILLTILSFYYFAKKNKSRYIIISILGLYTHYFFVFVIITQCIYQYMVEKKSIAAIWKNIKIPVIVFVPWFFYVASTLTSKVGEFWILPPTPYDILISPAVLFTGYERNYFQFYDGQIILLSILLIVIIGYSIVRNIRTKSRIFFLLLAWSFLFYGSILIFSFIKPIYLPRYLIFAAVGFQFFLFYSIEKSSKWARICIIVILFALTLHFWSAQIGYRTRGTERQTIQEIKKIADSQDQLFVIEPGTYFVASYYFGEKNVYLYNYQSQDVPYYVGKVLIPDNKIVSDLPRFPKKAFILINDNEYEIKSAY